MLIQKWQSDPATGSASDISTNFETIGFVQAAFLMASKKMQCISPNSTNVHFWHIYSIYAFLNFVKYTKKS